MLRFARWIRKQARDWRESKLNREKIGEDRFGNEYYQYYSHYGLPTRKEVHHANVNRVQLFEDVHFFSWLRRQTLMPPTDSELKKLYEEDRKRKISAIKHNKQSRELDQAYYERKAQVEGTWSSKPLTADDFQPEKWQPRAGKAGRAAPELAETEERSERT